MIKRISRRRLWGRTAAVITVVVLALSAAGNGFTGDEAQPAGGPPASSPHPSVGADAQSSSTSLPRAVRGENERIFIETDCLTAEVWPNGYVSGVKANTFVDRKTGARDSSFGLDIVDFLMGPGAEGGIPYKYGDKIHGNIAKHYIELPQICTQARHIDSEIIEGRDFVAVRQWWRWTEAAPVSQNQGVTDPI